MANEELLEIIKQGAKAWNNWRSDNLTAHRFDLIRANLRGTNLRGANLSEVDFSTIKMETSNGEELPSIEVDLSEADLSGANFSDANLCGIILRGANLTDANLRNADLSTIKMYTSNGEEIPPIESDLSGADLSRADLFGANLYGVNLSRANLSEAHLFGTYLSEANLSGADLYYANLTGVNLTKVDLSSATIGFTSFANIDLSTVNGLETVIHKGPSTIGVDTIYHSNGNIPEIFLRGAGLPDDFITYVRALTSHPIEFYSCFISYSSKDQDFAERLHADLQSKGVRCWFAPEDLKIGAKTRDTIDESIRLHDKLLLILSEQSVSSQWVEHEVEAALEREARENRLVLFPVRLDDAVMETDTAWAANIRRTRNVGDFRKWKGHDDYQKALDHVLRDLKAGDARSAT